eukprot:TRINITY_DN1869_c0_g1_i4.p1 TRINITY_DN1869_c0_g1~~TRINITY_DN1869_c0_g1_i4.p1  ORF type:complete len:190 (-),score=25.95 TRINITY_DN1869_c0_g1_i4:282-851(-)
MSFSEYEREFELSVSGLNRKISLLGSHTGEQKKETVRGIEEQLGYAREMIRSMREISAKKPAYEPKIVSYEKNLEKINSEYIRVRDNLVPTTFVKVDKNAQLKDDIEKKEYDQKTRLLVDHQKLEESRQRLQDTRRIGEETIIMGEDTLDTMKKQKEQLLHARDQVFFIFFYFEKNILASHLLKTLFFP